MSIFSLKNIVIALSAVILLSLISLGIIEYRNLRNKVSEYEKTVQTQEKTLNSQKEEIDSLNKVIEADTKTIEEKNKQLDEKIVKSTVTTSKTGIIKFSFGYPSELVPAYRVCFSNYDDISKQYCFWRKNTEDKRNYSNDVPALGDTVSSQVVLPVGKYIVDFSKYTLSNEKGKMNVLNTLALKQCVYYADGGEENRANATKYCKSLVEELKKETGMYLPFELANDNRFGGENIVIEVKAGKTTTMKSVSLIPYIDIN